MPTVHLPFYTCVSRVSKLQVLLTHTWCFLFGAYSKNSVPSLPIYSSFKNHNFFLLILLLSWSVHFFSGSPSFAYSLHVTFFPKVLSSSFFVYYSTHTRQYIQFFSQQTVSSDCVPGIVLAGEQTWAGFCPWSSWGASIQQVNLINDFSISRNTHNHEGNEMSPWA